MATMTLNGLRLEYRQQGSGPPLVLVHGGVSDLRSWDAQMDAFAASYRVIAYSRRYCWPNEEIPEGAGERIAVHVADLQAVLEALDAAPAHLVGHSWGAYCCLVLALRHPHLVRSLVLEETPVTPLVASSPPKPPELLKLLARRPRTAVALAGFGARVIKPAIEAFKRGDLDEGLRLFAAGVTGRKNLEDLPEARRAQFDRQNVKTLAAQFLTGSLEPITQADVCRLQTPTLLMNGQKSPAFFVRLTELLADLLPNAQRVEIVDASHWVHEDNPVAMNEAILAFLAARSSRER